MAKTNSNMSKTLLLDLKVKSLLNSLPNNPQWIEISKKSMEKTNHEMNKRLLIDLSWTVFRTHLLVIHSALKSPKIKAKTNHNMNETLLLDLIVNNLLNSPTSIHSALKSAKDHGKTNHKINRTLLLDLKRELSTKLTIQICAVYWNQQEQHYKNIPQDEHNFIALVTWE